MKNIYVLPTDKPSRLWYNDLGDTNELILSLEEITSNNNQHIYITNNEEPKGCDWYINNGHLLKCTELKKRSSCKKVILTTDPELIKDGVQPIDDEFLQWFVNNSTCEFVEVTYQLHINNNLYEINIPTEEPTIGKNKKTFQVTLDEKFSLENCVLAEETLEEIAEKLFPKNQKNISAEYQNSICRINWIKGAKYQAKRMYSEEEAGELVYTIIGQYAKECNIVIDGTKLNELFEQFKKKI